MKDISESLLYKKLKKDKGLSDFSIDLLLNNSLYKFKKKGDTIITTGKNCTIIVFVESGYLRTFIEKDGNEINTEFTMEGSFATNLKSLRLNLPSETTIQAETDTTIVEFDKQILLDLYKISPEIESFGRSLLEELLIEQEENSNLLRAYTPKERYDYLQKNRPEILQRVSLSQLSSYLGIARETLSRIRKSRS